MVNVETKLFKRFLVLVGMLCFFGGLMVYSASYVFAKETYGNSAYFFQKQMMALVIGVMISFVVGRVKFDFWYRYSQGILLFSSILLMLTLVPGLGIELKGSSRWLNFGVITFQPSEFEKIALFLASISYFHRFDFLEQKEKTWGFLQLVFPLLLNLVQPDYGTFSICLAIIIFSCFLSPFSRPMFFGILGTGAIVGLVALVMAPYRVKRLLVFLNPWSDPKGHGFQIIQSYLGFANGKVFGQGIGNSNEKLFYLPEAHNDFILSVIGEEFGFVGVLFLATIFLILLVTGLRLALSLRDPRHSLCVAVATFTIVFQAFLNMGVVLGLLPTKGLNLPFISFGGTSLVANLLIVGIIYSVIRSDQKVNNIRSGNEGDLNRFSENYV